jgi:hypothetical protein
MAKSSKPRFLLRCSSQEDVWVTDPRLEGAPPGWQTRYHRTLMLRVLNPEDGETNTQRWDVRFLAQLEPEDDAGRAELARLLLEASE